MAMQIFKFRIEFITSEEDVDDEVVGFINHEKGMVEIIDFTDGKNYSIRGFVPFNSIKKLEIIEEIGMID
ncbi:MAG: hypothetical protein M1165_02820 [Candidatus Pacearchaeota archaeon]|nr:hypothetical protein [Candidatus Pacearchaeota archaeon]MDE1849047.1 hypothetical protein [Nanoarchaeota archaeon]